MRDAPGPFPRPPHRRTVRLRSSCFCVFALLSGGCANNQGLEGELSRLRQELHGLRSEVVAADARIRQLERRLDIVAARRRVEPASGGPQVRGRSRREPARPAQAPSPERQRQLPVVKLGAPNPEKVPSEAPSTEEVGAVDRGEPPVLIRVRGRRSEKLTVDREVLERPDPVLSGPPKDPAAAYHLSLRKLRKAKDPEAALAGFEAFLEGHPKHRLADNALYWSGECHQMLVQHVRALAAFEGLVQEFPRSNKVPWAKLRAAESHMALGRREKARALLRELLRAHPKSEPAELARAQLEALASIQR